MRKKKKSDFGIIDKFNCDVYKIKYYRFQQLQKFYQKYH